MLLIYTKSWAKFFTHLLETLAFTACTNINRRNFLLNNHLACPLSTFLIIRHKREQTLIEYSFFFIFKLIMSLSSGYISPSIFFSPPSAFPVKRAELIYSHKNDLYSGKYSEYCPTIATATLEHTSIQNVFVDNTNP